MYQSICWKKALIPMQELPDPANWGWKRSDTGWESLWTTMPEASQACHELRNSLWMQERIYQAM